MVCFNPPEGSVTSSATTQPAIAEFVASIAKDMAKSTPTHQRAILCMMDNAFSARHERICGIDGIWAPSLGRENVNGTSSEPVCSEIVGARAPGGRKLSRIGALELLGETSLSVASHDPDYASPTTPSLLREPDNAIPTTRGRLKSRPSIHDRESGKLPCMKAGFVDARGTVSSAGIRRRYCNPVSQNDNRSVRPPSLEG